MLHDADASVELLERVRLGAHYLEPASKPIEIAARR